MNKVDQQYLNLLEKILKSGTKKTTRNDDGTLSLFGETMRFDLREGFPILTTKKIHFKSIVHELLWMLSGSTNIKYLIDNAVHVWDIWPFLKYDENVSRKNSMENDSQLLFPEYERELFPKFTLKEFITKIKNDDIFAEQWGDIGEGGYGKMFRNYEGTDQITETFLNLKNDPFSRRHVINLWHPTLCKKTLLPPCHSFHVYNCEPMSERERKDYMWRNYTAYESYGLDVDGLRSSDMDSLNVPVIRLNLCLVNRSSDVALGNPFNMSQYALLMSLFAHCLNYDVGEFHWTLVDAHLYGDQIAPIQVQLDRKGHKLPTLRINPKNRNILKFQYSDIELVDYVYDDFIKIPVTS